MATPLKQLLQTWRDASFSEREKGERFERLIQAYLLEDDKYDFENVWLWAEWAELKGIDGRDTGIDLVALDKETGVYWAIQCKFYAENAKIYRRHIDSFFAESGKAPFGQRLIVLTTANLSEHVESAQQGQQIPCINLTLDDLENSRIDWSKYQPGKNLVLRPKKKPFPIQKRAIEAVLKGFSEAERGKLLMACGTGKTFTALQIAEEIAGKGGKVLFLVPSISLLSQTLTEWTNDSTFPIHSFAVCSDTSTGKRSKSDDLADISPVELAIPATTDSAKLAAAMNRKHPDKMTVVFSTYHSLQVIAEAQADYGVEEFDLIICDEAHRTTGATLAGEDESNFVRIHDKSYVRGAKRLYMTATPRVFSPDVKSKADETDAVLCSMDDPALFGKTFFTVTFSEAVELGHLADYKVLVLAVDEEHVSQSIQKVLTKIESELQLDDATKIVGCWKALSKHGVEKDYEGDTQHPMQRAVAFCRDIKRSTRFCQYFPSVIEEYLKADENYVLEPLQCKLEHVDGKDNAVKRKGLISWLKEGDPQNLNSCNILSNARCLSEGVDVPALDAVLFIHPRKSQVDIVQAVGRVMRNSPGKKRGYVILPIGIPAGLTPEEALRDNERYKVVWQVLQALRSHDDTFDNLVNKIELGIDISSKMEVIAVTKELKQKKQADEDEGLGVGSGSPHDEGGESEETEITTKPVQIPMHFDIGDLEKAIYAKIVQKCGNRLYWEEWAGDIAKIAQTHITRISAALKDKGSKEKKAFDGFLEEIRDDLNESITEQDAIEMLAQHLITKPVFDALFEGYDFAKNNPVSLAMQEVLEVLGEHNFDNETESLQKFYKSVRVRAAGITDPNAKQKIIYELYEKFFGTAFKKTTQKLGIVYTPVEVVDFIIHSVNDVLQSEFGETLGSKGVHILDPFVGTGTFVTRLLQSGLIKPEELKHKYENEIHANEIVLLAYYIAAINIEAVYHSLSGGEYTPFSGICLTDTFQLYEKEDMISKLLVDNTSRRQRQKELDIKVIFGNPPYSAGQKSANDNAANVSYPSLDQSIASSYARHSTATLKNSLYDSYVRAIRWASDRVGDCGVVAYITNAGWLDSNVYDGMRKCLAEDFSSLYIFHLRGNQRTSGEKSKREGGKIFGSGSRAPIAISVLVKNPESKQQGQIFFHDIGDYLSRESKLEIVRAFRSISGIKKQDKWERITPDKHYDWVNKRESSFDSFLSIGEKKASNSFSLFSNYSLGLTTNRDAWCYNSSNRALERNLSGMIKRYNDEVARCQHAIQENENVKVEDLIELDPSSISWTRALKGRIKKGSKLTYDQESVTIGCYRPFSKMWIYFNNDLNEAVSQMPKFFSKDLGENRVIAVTGRGSYNPFSALMTAALPDQKMLDKCQCFPLKLYEKTKESREQDMFQSASDGFQRRDGITEAALKHFKEAYSGEKITKEDIFYYIYGLLHSEEYRSRFEANLSKELPKIPCVKRKEDFRAFSRAGRELGELHVDYESVDPYPVKFAKGKEPKDSFGEKEYRVEKMKFGTGKDKTVVKYNGFITMTDIPIEAYDYQVNGRSPMEWVMDRQCVKTDKKSGIVNDANRYAIETVGDPAYPLKLFQRVITVSLKTQEIVKSLPELDI